MSKIGYIRHLSKSESIDLQLLKLRSYGSICIFIESKTRRNSFHSFKTSLFFQYSFNENINY